MHVVADTLRDPGVQVRGAVIPLVGQYLSPIQFVQAGSAMLFENVPARHYVHVVADTLRNPGLQVRGAIIPRFGQYLSPMQFVHKASVGLLENVPAAHYIQVVEVAKDPAAHVRGAAICLLGQ